MKEMNADELQRRLEEIRVAPSRELDESVRRMADAAEDAETAAANKAAPAADPGWARLLRSRLFRIAACLVLAGGVALTLWRVSAKRWEIMPSAYAQMEEAFANSKAANWIHVHGSISGESVELWLSKNPYRSFKKEGNGQLEVFDFSAGRQYAFSPVTRLIITSQISEKLPPEMMGKTTFLDIFEAGIKAAQDQGIAQVTRGQRTTDGKTYTVVKLVPKHDYASVNKGFAPSQEIVIDPLEKRVVQVEVFEKDGGKSIGMIQFDYPAVGPEDIYALGAPKDARVVNAPTPTAPVVDFAVEDIQEKVRAARDQFAPTYCAAVVQGHVQRDGSIRPQEVDVTYKKNGRWRVERYVTAKPPDEQGRRIMMDALPDDMESIMAWVKDQRASQIGFLTTLDATDFAHLGVTFEIGKNGTPEETRGGGFEQFTPEFFAWDEFLIYKGERTLLPGSQGTFGSLAVVERKTQGNINEKGYVAVPQRMQWSLNASRDYIVEAAETVSNPDDAPWQVDKDWRKGVKLGPLQENRFSDSRQVLEYAQTAQGQWYAKNILKILSSSRADTSRQIWSVHLDTEREIPDDLFDPAKVKERLDSGQVPYLQAFDQAIAMIDSRTTWPATPEDVAKAYLEAGAQSQWDEVAVLCPGSGATDRRNWRGPQGQWVTSQGEVTGPDQVTIRCALADTFAKDGRYTHFIFIAKSKSKKQRYYVVGGPY